MIYIVISIIVFSFIIYVFRNRNVEVDHTRYDFFLEKYNNSKTNVSKKCDIEIEKAKKALLKATSQIEKRILLSFIDNYKRDKLEKLISFSKYDDADLTDKLDTLLNKAAKKVVMEQKCSRSEIRKWFNLDLRINIGNKKNLDRASRIFNQLNDCGIIDVNFEQQEPNICYYNETDIKVILKKNKKYPLLPKSDKIELNKFFDQELHELLMQDVYTKAINDIDSKTNENICGVATKEFLDLVDKYHSISYREELPFDYKNNSNGEYYYNNDSFNLEFDSPDDAFNYIKYRYNEYLLIKSEKKNIWIYFYPDIIIVAKNHLEYDLIDYQDFKLTFEKQQFIEQKDKIWSEDAKLLKHTEDGLPVYEYGVFTIEHYNIVMLIESSDMAETFYRAFCEYRNNKPKTLSTYSNVTSDLNEDRIDSRINNITTMIDKNETADLKFGATKDYFEKAYSVTKPLCEFFDTISKDNSILQVADYSLPDSWGDKNNKIKFLFFADLIKCFEQLGHDSTKLFSKEGLPIAIIETYVGSKHELTYQTIRLQSFIDVVEGMCEINESIKKFLAEVNSEDHFYIKNILEECKNRDLLIKYFSVLYKFFSVIAKADNTISSEEARWLEKLMSFSQSSSFYETEDYSRKDNIIEWKPQIKAEKPSTLTVEKTKEDKPKEGEKIISDNNPFEELESLIGLSEVKKEVSALANFVKIQKEREKKGMKAVGLSYHCVFTGNPGTGKTTVARIVAEIYRSLGVLKKGHLVETDRSGLVAEYVGQTATKTNKIIDSALDGVLFIDEAYSLIQGGGNDFGHEAISTLLKRMEDDRDRIIVIIAGYSKEIKDFVDSNPGLQSRFTRFINFSDYSAEDLKQIFLLNMKKNQYTMDEDGKTQLDAILKYETEHKDKNFGNGRYVRNLFEKTIMNQAIRLSNKPNVTADDLTILLREDLPSDVNIDLTKENIEVKDLKIDNKNLETKSVNKKNSVVNEIVSLTTTQRVLESIKSRKSEIFIQEIRPETESLFCKLDADGYVEEIDGVLQPRHYDALKLFSKHETCIFEIRNAEIELLVDKDNKLITYEVNGEEYIKAQIVYYLGDEIKG